MVGGTWYGLGWTTICALHLNVLPVDYKIETKAHDRHWTNLEANDLQNFRKINDMKGVTFRKTKISIKWLVCSIFPEMLETKKPKKKKYDLLKT